MESLPFAGEDDSTVLSDSPNLHVDRHSRRSISQRIQDHNLADRTTFFSLPVEIRHQIYRFLLVSPDDQPIPLAPQNATVALYLRLVSHLIRSGNVGLFAVAYELAEIFWSENSFVAHGKQIGHTPPLIRYSDHSRYSLGHNLDWDHRWTKGDVVLLRNYWCRLFLRHLTLRINLDITVQFQRELYHNTIGKSGVPWRSEYTDLNFLKFFPALREVTLTFVVTKFWTSYDQTKMKQSINSWLSKLGVLEDGVLAGTRIRCKIQVVVELTPAWESIRRQEQSQLVVYQHPLQELLEPFIEADFILEEEEIH